MAALTFSKASFAWRTQASKASIFGCMGAHCRQQHRGGGCNGCYKLICLKWKANTALLARDKSLGRHLTSVQGGLAIHASSVTALTTCCEQRCSAALKCDALQHSAMQCRCCSSPAWVAPSGSLAAATGPCSCPRLRCAAAVASPLQSRT